MITTYCWLLGLVLAASWGYISSYWIRNSSSIVANYLRSHSGRIMILSAFLVLVIIVPISLGMLVYKAILPRVLVESLIGRWPDPNLPKNYSVSKDWVARGIAIGACALFGIPTLLGVFFTWLVDRTKRSIVMDLHEALHRRDNFLKTQLYVELKKSLEKDEISAQRCGDIAQRAVDQASALWEQFLPTESLRHR